MLDRRDPQKLGEAILELRRQNPDRTASQCADMIETIYRTGLPATLATPQTYNAYAENGNGNHANHNSDDQS